MSPAVKAIFIIFWGTVVYSFFFFISKDSSYFLRDDYDFLFTSKHFQFNDLLQPHNQHFLPILRLVYLAEYSLFHLNFPGYLLVSILIHLFVVFLVFLIIRKLTKDFFISITGAMALSLLGSSYKVYILLASQTMLIAAVFSLLTIYCFINYLQNKTDKYFYLSLGFGLAASWCHGIGLAALPALWLCTLLFASNKLKNVVLSAFVTIVSFIIYFLALHQTLIPEMSGYLTWNYPLEIIHFIREGITTGTVGGLFYPWSIYTKVWPIPIMVKQFLNTFVYCGLVVILLLGLRYRHRLSHPVVIISLLSFFALGHFAIIGLGRAHNLGYTLSPQYTYYPKTLVIVVLYFLLYTLTQSIKTYLRYTLLGLITILIIVIQATFYQTQLYEYHERIDYTKRYLSDVRYVLTTQKQVLDLYLPNSITPVHRFSEMASLWDIPQKPTYISPENINIQEYLNQIRQDKRAYLLYKDTFEGYDIVHY